jgi:phosphoserine phosphatase
MSNPDLDPYRDLQKPLALFDVDGVLVKPFVIEHFPRYIVQHGITGFGENSLREMERIRTEYERSRLSYEEFASQLINVYARGVAGQSVTRLARLAQEFWEHSTGIVYPYTSELIGLVKPHFTMIAISGSPIMALDPILSEWGFDLKFATEIETTPDGIYTEGVVANRATDEGKNNTIELLKKHVASELWEKSIAFGDHPRHDLPLLTNVTAPFLFVGNEHSAENNEAVKELTSKIPRLKIVDRDLEKQAVLSIVRDPLIEQNILP